MFHLYAFPLLLPLLQTPGENGGGGREPVPYDRFQAVVNEKNTLTAEVTNLRGEVQKLSEKAATVDTLSGQVNEWKGKAEAAESRFSTFTEFSGALGSTDADVIGQFDAKYRALPEKDRPTRAAWVETLKSKPEEAPTVLRPWLTPAQAGQGGGTPPRPPAPRANGAGTPPAAPSPVSDAEVARIREQCIKTNNWQPWKDFKKANGLP